MKSFRFLGKGIGHEDSGKGCQDKLSTIGTEDGRYIYAIADGCSSSKYAEESAQCNIDVINKVFSRFSINELTRDSFVEIYPQLEKHLHDFATDDIVSCFNLVFKYELSSIAKKLCLTDANMSDFCATLLFAVVENKNTMIGHIGDGNIVFYDIDGHIICRSAEENGEDSRHTYFTINDNFIEHFYCETIPTNSFYSMILFSDGPQTMFKLEKGEIAKGAYEIVVEPIVSNQIKTEQELVKRLQLSLANAMHYGFDDWSIIVATKQPENSSNIEPISLKQLFMELYSGSNHSVNDVKSNNDENDDSKKDSPKTTKVESPSTDIPINLNDHKKKTQPKKLKKS